MKINSTNLELVFKSKACSVETMELKGYSLIVELFCDSSGFGSPDEPAMTPSQLIDELKRITNERGTVYTAITGQGQFQVYVGVFQKLFKSKKDKLIDANTLEYTDGDITTIRLYDTDILRIDRNKQVLTLSCGDYQTKLTKDRLNKYLEPYNLYITQENFNWTVRSNLENTAIPFSDGITINY